MQIETAEYQYDKNGNQISKTTYESKVGFKSNGQPLRIQALKDAELLQKGTLDSVTWHFFRSADTGKIGAAQGLLDLLTESGIKYKIYN